MAGHFSTGRETPITEVMNTERPAAPLSVQRIREVLAAWPPAGDPDVSLVADYHRIIEIHQCALSGGVAAARDRAAAHVEDATPAPEAAAVLPARDGLGTRRMVAVHQDMAQSARAALERLWSIAPAEEEAVAACREEIEAALARMR